jgi:hypothetical protein
MKFLFFKYVIFSLACFSVLLPFAAKAEEQLMELWPNQRAKYVVTSEENAAKFEARGRDYVAYLYATGGEEPIAPADDFMYETEPEIDPVAVDVNQVSDIVGKYTGSIIEDSVAPDATPVTPAQ